ncbi:hypothetical protein ABPG72_013575 [Tetrahymena utriculariae]
MQKAEAEENELTEMIQKQKTKNQYLKERNRVVDIKGALRYSTLPRRVVRRWNIQIGDAGASGIGSALAQCANLSNLELDLGENQIGDAGASGLGFALAQCANLSNLTLNLRYNKIGHSGASGLGSALAQCTNLQNLTLDLFYNLFGNAGASGLGSALAQCANLSNLELDLGQKQFICCFGM